MGPILPPVPLHGRSEEARRRLDASETADLLGIGVEHNLVGAGRLDADAIVREALSSVEVENEDAAAALKHDNFITLILEADIRLGRVQPPVVLLRQVHLAVELIQVLVPQETVLCEVHLTPRIPERVLVPLTRKVEPFWMAEFVAFEVEVAFTPEAVRE